MFGLDEKKVNEAFQMFKTMAETLTGIHGTLRSLDDKATQILAAQHQMLNPESQGAQGSGN